MWDSHADGAGRREDLQAANYFVAPALRKIRRRPSTSKRKRITDIVVASTALFFFSPLFALIYILVRLDGGDAFFAQDRIGKDGRVFRCYKFRSMLPNAERRLEQLLTTDPARRLEWERDQKFHDDPRVTAIGKFLRRKSLDELPQLWNVLKGDMSIVGPRPIVADEKSKYGEAFWYYINCRPGLTGAWQVSGRNNTTYDQRVSLDSKYALSWSLRKDILIMFKTLGVVWAERGAR